MASYVTTGFSKQLLVYTSYIFYVDPLIRETLSTVISYRKSFPSRVLSRHPSFAPRIRISRAFPHSRIATWSKLYTSKVRSVRSLISPSAQGSLLFSWTTRWDDDGLPSYPPSVLLLWRSPWLTQSMTVTPTMTELFFDNESSPS